MRPKNGKRDSHCSRDALVIASCCWRVQSSYHFNSIAGTLPPLSTPPAITSPASSPVPFITADAPPPPNPPCSPYSTSSIPRAAARASSSSNGKRDHPLPQRASDGAASTVKGAKVLSAGAGAGAAPSSIQFSRPPLSPLHRPLVHDRPPERGETKHTALQTFKMKFEGNVCYMLYRRWLWSKTHNRKQIGCSRDAITHYLLLSVGSVCQQSYFPISCCFSIRKCWFYFSNKRSTQVCLTTRCSSFQSLIFPVIN